MTESSTPDLLIERDTLRAQRDDLLVALKELDRAICGDMTFQAERMLARKAIVKARAAIAKAEAL